MAINPSPASKIPSRRSPPPWWADSFPAFHLSAISYFSARPTACATDGDYSARQIFGPTKKILPFTNWPTKDNATTIFERTYEIDRTSYAPFAAAATLPNDGPEDPADANAYIIDEGDPVMQPDGTEQVLCRFAHIPPAQTKIGSLMVNLPSIPASFTYNTLDADGAITSVSTIFRFAEQYIVDGRATVYFDIYPLLPAGGATTVVATGGTFTFTYKTGTTAALAYNASNSAIATAINALASIMADGITVTATNQLTLAGTGNLQLVTGASGFLASPSVNGAGLTLPYGLTGGVNQNRTGAAWAYQLPLILPVAAHGYTNTGQNLMGSLSSGSTNFVFLCSSANWAVGDANNLLLIPFGSFATNPFQATSVGIFTKRYTPGSLPCPCTLVTRFSATPITPDTYEGGTYTLLQKLFANAASINYAVGDSALWPKDPSPIYSLTTTKINASAPPLV